MCSVLIYHLLFKDIFTVIIQNIENLHYVPYQKRIHEGLSSLFTDTFISRIAQVRISIYIIKLIDAICIECLSVLFIICSSY